MRRADALLTAILLAGCLAFGVIATGERPLDTVGYGLIVISIVPLVLRSLYPITTLVAVLVASTAYHAQDFPHDALLAPLLVALYTVASRSPRRWALLIGAGVVTEVAVVGWLTADAEVADGAGWMLAALAIGEAVRHRRAYVAELEDRAERVVLEERLRIARDLHDVLAHTITVAQVQAGVAAHLLDGSGDKTPIKAALANIVNVCDQARTELRTTLDVLRSDPVPGLAGLSTLVTQVQAAGIEVTMEVSGGRRPLPAAVDVAAYRIAQEALTNVVKHSGAQRAVVSVDYQPDNVLLTISDNGRGGSGVGHGLLGMMERAKSVGGNVSAGPVATGGFAVQAVLQT